jgi:predicted transcriptional regulator
MEQKVKINTTNPESITYQTEELSFTILGGIKLEGLDRLRVTLKIEVANRKFKHYLNNPDIADLALRQNLDLYNDTQVEKLIRRTAERLEVGSTAIAKAVADITNQLETYRLQQIEANTHQTAALKKLLTADETETAKEFLQQPNLIQRTCEYIGKSGVIGEELNRILMYIIFTSRKLSHPLHVVSLGSSGTGKTHLQEKVSELIPDEDKLEITTLSENAFYYFGQRELSHKLILIEDLDGAINVLFPLRELQSKKRISKTVTFKDTRGITKTITLTVEGPVSVAGCTTRERIYEDNANRSFLIYLDESSEQDNKIMQYQRELAAGLINTDEQEKIKQLLQNTQRVLQNIKIVNPYAPQLQLPKEVFKPRRTNKHYLDFIEAITFYHQWQRHQQVNEETGEIYIETTIEDIEEANKLMKEILLRKADELSGACRNYFEQLKKHLEENKQTSFTNRSMGQALRIAHSTIKRYHFELHNAGLIKTIHDKKAKTYWYEITTAQEYEQLKASINNALDEVLQKIKSIESDKKQLTGSNRLTDTTKPTNPKNSKGNKQRLTKDEKDNADQKNNEETEAAE